MKEELEQARLGIQLLWYIKVSEQDYGPLSEILAKIIGLLADAERIAENPKLKQMMCVRFGGEIHIHSSKFDVLCGNGPKLTDTFVPDKCVPTCPDCIERYVAAMPSAPNRAQGDNDAAI